MKILCTLYFLTKVVHQDADLFTPFYLKHNREETKVSERKSRQRSGHGAIRQKFPFQKPRWEKLN